MVNSTNLDQLDELIHHAIYQQFFLGKDKIMGRMPLTKMSFKNIGTLLEKFILELKDVIIPINFKNMSEFKAIISYFENKFNMDLDGVEEKINKNFSGLDNVEDNEVLIIYTILTKIMESVRESAYKKYGLNEFIKRYEKITKKKYNEEIKKKFQELSSLGDPSISLLYNLCFVRLLAEEMGDKKTISNAKRQISKKINELIKKIVNIG